MRLVRICVKNFGPFSDTGWIALSSGINLIIGQNNAGKSALLRSLEFPLVLNPHRNEAAYEKEQLQQVEIDLDLELAGPELEDAILKFGQRVAWPAKDQEEARPNHILALLKSPIFSFEITRQPRLAFGSRRNPSHGLHSPAPTFHAMVQAQDGRISVSGPQLGGSDSLVSAIEPFLKRKLFSFDAQRYSIGKTGHGRADRLTPNASNLAQVLAVLQGERGSLFKKLVGHLQEIFPTVGNLSVTALPTELEIRVWPTEVMDRPELSFDLNNSGTGLAQVIAILTVMMTFDEAIIVVDEISSFLHPAAIKALFRIMQTQYAHHQYVISTHSPEVINAANPASLHLVQRHGYESSVEPIDLAKVSQLREIADHLGVSMSDVFAADRIIWVEGPTEELCFPYIYNQAIGPLPRGLIITPVIATGDFLAKTKRRELIFEVYQRLSQATSPLVKTVTFSFDRETLSEAQMHGLTKTAQGRLAFLPRRHFECFLINPAAIVAFVKNHVPELEQNLSEQNVIDQLHILGGDPRFGAQNEWNGDISDGIWSAKVDAAALIKELCSQLTNAKLEFAKKLHSLELLQHILINNRETVKGLIDYVENLVHLAETDAT